MQPIKVTNQPEKKCIENWDLKKIWKIRVWRKEKPETYQKKSKIRAWQNKVPKILKIY